MKLIWQITDSAHLSGPKYSIQEIDDSNLTTEEFEMLLVDCMRVSIFGFLNSHKVDNGQIVPDDQC